MIKANELRIGNCVYGFKTIWQIDETDFKTVDTDSYTMPYDPISITPEILEKFGFKEQEHSTKGNCFVLNDFIVFTEGKIRGIDHPFTCINKKDVLIPYLHQLQNIYFALTGEELEINPT